MTPERLAELKRLRETMRNTRESAMYISPVVPEVFDELVAEVDRLRVLLRGRGMTAPLHEEIGRLRAALDGATTERTAKLVNDNATMVQALQELLRLCTECGFACVARAALRAVGAPDGG